MFIRHALCKIEIDTPDKLKRQSARLKKFHRLYLVMLKDSQSISTIVRVVPQEIVAGIEEGIAIQEKKEYQKQTSAMT